MKFYPLLIFFFSCADIFIPDDNSYKSIYLDGNAWIEIENQYDCDNGLKVIDDDFLIEIYFSGGENLTNDAGTIFSFLGKSTENLTDTNCNGQWDEGEEFIDELNGIWDEGEELTDCNESGTICEDDQAWNPEFGNGIWDEGEEFIDELNGIWDEGEEFSNNEYIVLAVSDDPSNSSVLSFYINDDREEVEIDGTDFTNSEEFHLLQIFSNEGTIYFYLDNSEVYSKSSDIMIQGESFMVGALANDSFIGNLWHGHMDEIRLWKSALTDEIRTLHYEYPDKLIDTMQDNMICDLVGLWTFNYDEPSSDIHDEKCEQINNLNENSCECDLFLLDGTLYTLPGSEANYSVSEF